VDIDWNDLVQALYDAVNVVHSAGIAAGTHGDHPFGFGHLFIESQNDGGYLLEDSTCHDQEVGLPGRSPQDFGPKSGQVKTGCKNGSHLDKTA
jgi:hypothetical protein